jgi:hypothetical protein
MTMSETFDQNSLGQQVSTQCQSIGLLTITTLQVQVKEKKYDVSPYDNVAAVTSSFINESKEGKRAQRFTKYTCKCNQ